MSEPPRIEREKFNHWPDPVNHVITRVAGDLAAQMLGAPGRAKVRPTVAVT